MEAVAPTVLAEYLGERERAATHQRTDRNDYALVMDGGAWKIQADAQPSAQSVTPGSGSAPAQTQPDTTGTSPARTSDTSSNWSGYAANGGTSAKVVSGVPVASAADASSTKVNDGLRGSMPLRRPDQCFSPDRNSACLRSLG